ncbi:MAG: hypothetical protein J5616_05635 [Bacteroidaceae bacterium]|nr:hypothetical protein [Bacteroidaceae bacterium]
MTQIDDILDRLQGQMPTLDNPEEMVDTIMASLPDVKTVDIQAHALDAQKKPSAMLIALRTITSAAAILLIGLFFYVNQPMKTEAQNAYAYTTDFPRRSTLENMYTRYTQANQPKPISYTQIKRMLYAKN